MKLFKLYGLLAVCSASGLAGASITSYTSASSFYEYQYVFDPISTFYTYPHSVASSGNFGSWADTGGWSSTNLAGETDNIYTDGAFGSSLIANTASHLETGASFYGYCEVTRGAPGLNTAIGVAVGEQTLTFTVDAAATVHLTANNIYHNGVFGTPYSLFSLDGNYYSFAPANVNQTITVGAGTHVVFIHGEVDTTVDSNGGTFSFADELTGYNVDINAVPEPCSMIALGGVALLAVRRRRAKTS